MTADCCALILNYNGEKILADTVNSLLGQTRPVKIAVIDNNSSDGSIALLRTRYPAVEIIRNRENLDFGKAYNRAIAGREEKYIFILNNDIVVGRDGVKNALGFMEKNPDAGAVSFIPFEAGEKVRYPYARDFLVKKRFGVDLKTAVRFGSPSAPPHYATYIWGGASIVRRKIFETVRFDEDLGWYFEDADLGWMVNNRTRYRTVVLANAVVHHMGGYSTKRRFAKEELSRRDHRNAMLSFMKNGSTLQLLAALPQMLYFLLRQKDRLALLRLMYRKFRYERVRPA